MVDFKINQDFIYEILCINKQSDITVCGGQCYLAKKLNGVEETDQKRVPQGIQEKSEILVFVKLVNWFSEDRLQTASSVKLRTYRQSLYSTSFIKSIFHPPEFPVI
ncbi:hypothetical protein [Fulvivirga sp. M361]|uniref:hypothetical protein n=1 Tax=Fulvivirga sp. M361 TaxID=2594266 RepID=UPI00117A7BBA|nr:hypothetical protein [Fulvivirga sp. M361]